MGPHSTLCIRGIAPPIHHSCLMKNTSRIKSREGSVHKARKISFSSLHLKPSSNVRLSTIVYFRRRPIYKARVKCTTLACLWIITTTYRRRLTENMFRCILTLSLLLVTTASCKNIILTNDDGWAVAQIRAQNDALKAAGFNVCYYILPSGALKTCP